MTNEFLELNGNTQPLMHGNSSFCVLFQHLVGTVDSHFLTCFSRVDDCITSCCSIGKNSFQIIIIYGKSLPTFCTDDQLYANAQLKKIVTHPSNRMEFMMEPGDLIFINNKTMLHGRSSFNDSNRHMLRIRMNKRNYSQLN